MYAKLEVFYGEVPFKIQQNIEKLVQFEVNRKTLSLINAVQLTQFLQMRNSTESKEGLLSETQNYINERFKYLES